MKRLPHLITVLLLVLLPILQAEESPKITYSGGDGSSFEKAVIILGADATSGVKAEYQYLQKKFPGYQPGSQSLVEHDKRMYDVLEISTPSGPKKVYFDITDFFGKF